MQLSRGFRVTLGVALSVALASPVARAGDQDDLATARELYVAAAYEDALHLLDRLSATDPTSERDRATIDQYRALCLLALNREPEAVTAIESMIRQDPLYGPPQADLSPRTRQLFQDVRRRVLPSVAQDRYTQAKAAYQAGRAEEAAADFDTVVQIIDTFAADAPPLMGDLRVLATGFRDLAAAAAARAADAARNAAQARSSIETPVAPPPPKAEEAPRPIEVSPPVTVRQNIPPWPGDVTLPRPAVAVIEVVIGPDGRVTEARLQRGLHPRYDQLLLAAAREWVYRPALRDGRPTPFVKAVRIELSPPR